MLGVLAQLATPAPSADYMGNWVFAGIVILGAAAAVVTVGLNIYNSFAKPPVARVGDIKDYEAKNDLRHAAAAEARREIHRNLGDLSARVTRVEEQNISQNRQFISLETQMKEYFARLERKVDNLSQQQR